MLTDLKVTSHSVLGGKDFGTTGSYEQLHGSARFEIDPSREQNARVVDLNLAPRNAASRVECRADIWILRPSNPDRANGALMYQVVNRGRKGLLAMYNLAEGSNRPETDAHFGDGFLMKHGYSIAACAWQADVPPSTPEDEHLMTLDVPVATQDGKTIEGPIGCEIIVDAPCDLHPLGSRFHAPYDPAKGLENEAHLSIREMPYDAHQPLDDSTWTFDRMEDGRPAIRYPQGFIPGKIYNFIYTGCNPKVMGLGFATTRDFVSYMKYEADEHDDLKDLLKIDRALAFGSSQSGRFLRHLLYEGFNQDEKDRQVFDGVIANVAGGGMGSFNHRFAQPSRHASAHFDVYYPTEQFPFNDLPQADPITDRTDGLLARCDETETTPKIFYTNTSTEYWNRSASLTHTDVTGTQDSAIHPSVRIYHFAGTQHGPADLPQNADELSENPVNFRLGHRALLVALNKWIAEGDDPPESRHGTISDGTLVALEQIKESWPRMPLALPSHPRDPRRLNHGAGWNEGVITNEPPVVLEPYRMLLPRVDEDGNEIPGIRLPEVAVPLGTFAGWRLRSAEIGSAWAIVGLQGFWLPFPKNHEPEDVRPMVSQRYADRADYIDRCLMVADALISDRYLLSRDRERIASRARILYNWVSGSTS